MALYKQVVHNISTEKEQEGSTDLDTDLREIVESEKVRVMQTVRRVFESSQHLDEKGEIDMIEALALLSTIAAEWRVESRAKSAQHQTVLMVLITFSITVLAAGVFWWGERGRQGWYYTALALYSTSTIQH
jgi:hypothetical protein